MKQSLLIDVPKTGLTIQQRLNAFKEREGILTHRADFRPREDHPWLALVPFKSDQGKDIGLIMSESCRIYDESGQCATGTGELSAVRTLCRQLNILCDV